MGLPSIQARAAIDECLKFMRVEYVSGFQNRYSLARWCEDWLSSLKALEPGEQEKLTQLVSPLLHRYEKGGQGERKKILIEVGKSLSLFAGITKPSPEKEPTREELRDKEPSPEPPQEPLPPAPRVVSEGEHYAEAPPGDKASLKLEDTIQYVKGVGPRMAKMLGILGIFVVRDLLEHFPRRWEDRRFPVEIASVNDEDQVLVEGKIVQIAPLSRRGKMAILKAKIADGTAVLDVVWFNQAYLAKSLRKGATIRLFGKVEYRYGGMQMSSPEIGRKDAQNSGRLVPFYPLTRGVKQHWMRNLQYKIVPTYAPLVKDFIPSWVVERFSLLPRSHALLEHHWPSCTERRVKARQRLAFEELFLSQLELGLRKLDRESDPRSLFYDFDQLKVEEFLSLLPFTPTGAQSSVIQEIVGDLQKDSPMNRLLQGDVGSGKTLLAAFCVWLAAKAGYQSAVMAPTEILAIQHYEKMQELLEPAGIRVTLLTGKLRAKPKRQRREAIALHNVDVVVGTHALIVDDVDFARLAMVVVDEQHRFGVLQRARLRAKGKGNFPDLLVMTATPIPRTLALTLHGDLDVSVLDELPPGRQPIHSEYVSFSRKNVVFDKIRGELREGRQAYVVCALVEDSDQSDLKSATAQAKELQEKVFSDFKVGLLHGKMRSRDKESIMESFRQKEIEILVSTTVIEVGVDVPNATIMLVMDADRFGLAQLHQLRGRVGRGSHPSFCYFMADSKSPTTTHRLKTIAKFSDGFKVSEEDLDIRGPGDFFGLKQSGFPEFQVADLLRDRQMLERAREVAQELLERDNTLACWPLLRRELQVKGYDIEELVH